MIYSLLQYQQYNTMDKLIKMKAGKSYNKYCLLYIKDEVIVRNTSGQSQIIVRNPSGQ